MAAIFADSSPAFPGPVPADVVLGEDLLLLPGPAPTSTLRALVPTQGPDDDATSVATAAVHADRAELFARADGLSRRESEVLGLLLRGGRTRDLAETMRVSTHTVQDHLKAVFAKTGTHSRPAPVAQAFGALP